MKQIFALLLALTLTACASDATKITPASFADMAGWTEDRHAEPFGLFVESCHANANRAKAYQSREEGPIGVRDNWRRACEIADLMEQPTDAEARQFFEIYFQPYRVETEHQKQGLITGYYEPIINGSKIRKAPYLTPVYGVPDDLGARKPYYTREEILHGALKGHAKVLAYVDDPVLLFFLHVQGSGKLRLPDGHLIGLQYAGQNGYPYVPIGKILKDRGELTTLSMQAIRDWLYAHPDQMDEVMNQNQSYIFFKFGPGDKAAKGALGLPLTPLRSIAIDNDRATYGVPTWIDTTQSQYQTGTQIPLRRLFISQDTGGAIKGPHRADLFYGQGTVEEWQAGHQNSRANVFWLLPLREAAAPAPTVVIDLPASPAVENSAAAPVPDIALPPAPATLPPQP